MRLVSIVAVLFAVDELHRTGSSRCVCYAHGIHETAGNRIMPQLPAPANSRARTSVPKTIWMYWSQGGGHLLATRLEHRACHQSWLKNNPTWKVRVVSVHSIARYIGPARSEEVFAVKSLQSQSDLARLYLLMLHGGVYVDADVFSVVPLNNWLEQAVSPAGFFLFSLAGRDRLVSSWFIAAAKTCGAAETICPGVVASWAQATGKYLRHNNHQFQNYLQMHYIFTEVVTSMKGGVGMSGYQLSQSWAKVPKVYATTGKEDPCCVPALSAVPRVAVRALSGGFCAALTADAKAMIDSGQVPMIKGRAKRGPQGTSCPGVNHDDSKATPPAGSILEYLMAIVDTPIGKQQINYAMHTKAKFQK